MDHSFVGERFLQKFVILAGGHCPCIQFGKPSYCSTLQLWMFVFGWKTFSNDNICKNLMGLSMIICQKGDATEHTWMQQKSSWSIACSIISWTQLAWAALWWQTETPPMCLRPWLSRLLWIGLAAHRSSSFCFFFPFGSAAISLPFLTHIQKWRYRAWEHGVLMISYCHSKTHCHMTNVY